MPVVLEDHGTSAAALIAARLAPAVRDYLVAAHGGTRPSHRRALAALGPCDMHRRSFAPVAQLTLFS